MQPGITVALAAALKTRAKAGLTRRAGKKSFSKCAQVEAGSSGHDGQAAASGNGFESSTGLAAVVARGEGLVGVGHVDQVMGQARPFFIGGLRRAEVHPAIDGDRVATDDLACEPLPQREGERRLAAPGGTEEQDGQGIGVQGSCAHSRHQPGGKIHAGLVWNSAQTKMAAATSTMPRIWFRR